MRINVLQLLQPLRLPFYPLLRYVPAAQLPSAVPSLSEHSVVDRHEPFTVESEVVVHSVFWMGKEGRGLVEGRWRGRVLLFFI